MPRYCPCRLISTANFPRLSLAFDDCRIRSQAESRVDINRGERNTEKKKEMIDACGFFVSLRADMTFCFGCEPANISIELQRRRFRYYPKSPQRWKTGDAGISSRHAAENHRGKACLGYGVDCLRGTRYWISCLVYAPIGGENW